MSVVSTEASAIQQFVTSNKTDEFCEGLYRSSPIPGNWYASKLCLITTVETCLATAISPGPSPRGEGSQNPCPARGGEPESMPSARTPGAASGSGPGSGLSPSPLPFGGRGEGERAIGNDNNALLHEGRRAMGWP